MDFESATAADIAAIDAGTIQSSNIKGKDGLIGAVAPSKRVRSPRPAAARVGLMKLVTIGEDRHDANARVFTFAVKLPKEYAFNSDLRIPADAILRRVSLKQTKLKRC